MSEKYRINPFFNGVSSFKTAFPTLSDALIEWRERRGPEDNRSGDLRKVGFRRGNFTQGVLACSNPDCHEGGYEIDRLVADMLRAGEMEREGLLLCSGRETGDEVRRGPVRCPYRIEYRAILTSKEEGPPEESTPRPRSPRRGRHRSRRRPAA
jgi:hypothetical protein